MSFRVSTARQELGIDHRPLMNTILDFAEFLQAEAEELSMATGSKNASVPGATATAVATPTNPVVKALYGAGQDGSGGDGEKPKQFKAPCRFWKSEDGCRKGSERTYLHDASDMKGRCFGCGATSHVKKDCPVKKSAEKEVKTEKVKKINRPKPEKGDLVPRIRMGLHPRRALRRQRAWRREIPAEQILRSRVPRCQLPRFSLR